MNCNEAISYIHSLERFGIMPGLERISELCEKLGNPQDKCKFIHVAGTNGKGSTCTMISEILIESGYNTGLYTSPYVIDFRERIKLNGEMIDPEDLAECTEEVKEASEKYNIKVTEFEAVTAVAFLYYAKKECDYVVLEVGLGGRYDATNIIKKPDVAVIASISKDHTAILGDTVSEIAGEKCGIIKDGCKVVSYALQTPDALEVIKNNCRLKSAELIIPDIKDLSVFSVSIKGSSIDYKGLKYNLRLAGEHIVYNSISAVEAVKALNIGLTDEQISSGISKAVVPARMELISDSPIILLDGGHNEDCGKALNKFVKEFITDKKIIMLSSIMADKDFDSYLSLSASLADEFIATKADVPRALDSKELCTAAKKYCDNCIYIENSLEAVKTALSKLNDNSALVICGSFYLAGEIRDYLLKGE